MFRRADPDVIGIAVLSALLCGTFWYLLPISFASDSEQYLHTAWALLNQQGEFYYYRTWGYPLALILTGSITSLQPILLLQALLGAATPIVIYATLRPFNRRMALVVAILSAVSCVPYMWQKLIMTDQLSLFLYYVLAFGAVRFMIRQSARSLGLVTVTSFALFLMRPSATLIFFCTAGCLLVFYRSTWRKLAAASLVFVAATQLFNVVQNDEIDHYTYSHPEGKVFHAAATKGAMAGKMFFFNAYAVGPYYAGAATIDRNNGPCSEEFYDDLVAWGTKNPGWMEAYLHVSSGPAFANLLLNNPTLFNHSIMWRAMDETLDGMKSDLIFRCVAFEALARHPRAAFFIPHGIIQFFMSGDVVYNSGQLVTWNADGVALGLVTSYLSTEPHFPKTMSAELSADQKLHAPTVATTEAVVRSLFYVQSVAKIIGTILAVLFFPFCVRSGRPIACFATLIVIYLLYQAAVAVAFAAPHFRYISPQIPFVFMLAGLGMFAFSQWWRMLRRRPAMGRAPYPA